MLLPFSINQIEYIILMFIRISTIMALLPVFGSQSIPAQLKVAFSLILTLIMFNINIVTQSSFPEVTTIIHFLTIAIKEVAVGLIIGYAASLLFTAVQIGGWLVDTVMGFGFVELVDPFNNESITVIGQLQVILFTVLFLLLNGHYFFILAIKRSFEVIPLTAVNLGNEQLVGQVVTMFAGIFSCAIKFAAPVFVTLLLTEVALGVVARTVPQMNIFFVGLPLKIITGLGTTILVLPFLATLFQKTMQALILDIHRLLILLS